MTPTRSIAALQRAAGNSATTSLLQRMRIGKIPDAAFLAAHVPAAGAYGALGFGDDVSDFNNAVRTQVVATNATYYAANPAGVHAHAPAGVPPVSDESLTQLATRVDVNEVTPEVDHSVPFKDWGCNDPRNARVLNARENRASATSRPGAGFRLVALEDEHDVAQANQGDVLTLNQIHALQDDLEVPNSGSIVAMTPDEIGQIYFDEATYAAPAVRQKKRKKKARD